MDSQDVRVDGTSPKTGTPPSVAAPATTGGEAPPPSRVRNLAPGRNVAHYDSIADAMLPPYPVGMPAIYPVPTVTNAQRRRLKRAIESYRDEA